MNASPKVSVIIPVYNRERYIAAAIDSILAQSFTDFELLLIDDGSTDNSVAVMQAYTDPRVRLVCNESNRGIPKTRNRGIELACSEYIAMLDSDDVALPHRLAKQVAFLDRHQDYAVVGSWATVMKQEGRPPRRIGILPVSPGDVQSRLLFHCSLTQSSIMTRTAVLRAYRYREQYVVCEDFDLWVRLARHYKLGNLPTFLVQRRMHPGRVTYEKTQLTKERKLQIFRTQLIELGVTFTDTDLERHFLLLRMKNSQFTPDREYLTWADAWLRYLQEANVRTLRSPLRPFAQVLSEVWVAVCWQATGSLGWTAWQHFWRSPLSTEVWSSARKYLDLIAFRRPPQES